MTGSVPAAHQPSASSVPQAQRTEGTPRPPGLSDWALDSVCRRNAHLPVHFTEIIEFALSIRPCLAVCARTHSSLPPSPSQFSSLLCAFFFFFFSQYTSVPLGVVDPSVLRIASAAGHVPCDGSYQPGIAPSFRFRLFSQVFVVECTRRL